MSLVSVLIRQWTNMLPSVGCFGYTSVRHRYWADKIAKGELIRGLGHKDKLFKGGLMPRLKNVEKLPIPDYRPKNSWSEKRALFGQNDYIDILGNSKLHPAKVAYDVPSWLRGVAGNEMQLLLKKLKTFGRGPYKHEYPTTWENMNKRIRYLYKYLNRKKRPHFVKR